MMRIKLRDDELGLAQVIHNGVEVEFSYDYDKVDQTRRLTELSAVRAENFGIFNRLELTLNGCEEYIDEDQEEETAKKYDVYFKDFSGCDEADVYQVHHNFNLVDPSGCKHHASKKILLSGVRTGGKGEYKDMEEARDTINRWLEINK
jgi:hypothetical protein